MTAQRGPPVILLAFANDRAGAGDPQLRVDEATSLRHALERADRDCELELQYGADLDHTWAH
jgi:hypothetical protein